MTAPTLRKFETAQPWVLYEYGLTHDKWWPPLTSTRILGRARIACECMVCGDRTVLSLRIPRVGPIPDRGHHPARNAYLAAHAHPDRGHPASWAKPLANLAAHPGGLDLDLLAMRLDAELNDALHVDPDDEVTP